jgi:nitrate reductase gamma subunit
MKEWLEFARGPLFWTAFAFMVLGLLRQLLLTVADAVHAWRRAGDRTLPVRRLTLHTLRWLVPVERWRNRGLYSAVTLLFHAGVILVPLFLAGHIDLWRQGTGLGWPALPNPVATALTLVAIGAAVAVVVQRAAVREARALSRLRDYLLPLFIALVMLSGFLVMHPQWNPVAPDATLLVHALGADVLLFLVPLSKLSHMVLLPMTQLVSELAWHFPPDAGARVAVTLGKEHEPV